MFKPKTLAIAGSFVLWPAMISSPRQIANYTRGSPEEDKGTRKTHINRLRLYYKCIRANSPDRSNITNTMRIWPLYAQNTNEEKQPKVNRFQDSYLDKGKNEKFVEQCIRKAASRICKKNLNESCIPFKKIDHLLQKSDLNPKKILYIISSNTVQQTQRREKQNRNSKERSAKMFKTKLNN